MEKAKWILSRYRAEDGGGHGTHPEGHDEAWSILAGSKG